MKFLHLFLFSCYFPVFFFRFPPYFLCEISVTEWCQLFSLLSKCKHSSLFFSKHYTHLYSESCRIFTLCFPFFLLFSLTNTKTACGAIDNHSPQLHCLLAFFFSFFCSIFQSCPVTYTHPNPLFQFDSVMKRTENNVSGDIFANTIQYQQETGRKRETERKGRN